MHRAGEAEYNIHRERNIRTSPERSAKKFIDLNINFCENDPIPASRAENGRWQFPRGSNRH